MLSIPHQFFSINFSLFFLSITIFLLLTFYLFTYDFFSLSPLVSFLLFLYNPSILSFL